MSEQNSLSAPLRKQERIILTAICAVLCFLSIMACFAPISSANMHSQINEGWSIAKYGAGSAFLFGILGALAATSVAGRVMLVLGAIAGPLTLVIVLSLFVSH